MMGNYQVRFLGGKGAAMPPTYPIIIRSRKRKEETSYKKKKKANAFHGISSIM